MRLTWRDGVTTLLLGVVLLIAFAVTEGWDWPLLGSIGAGVGAVAIVGLAMCILGGSGSATGSGSMTLKDPFVMTSIVLGTAALVLAIIGLVNGSEAIFVALVAVTAVLWVVSTTHHAVQGARHAPAHPAGA